MLKKLQLKALLFSTDQSKGDPIHINKDYQPTWIENDNFSGKSILRVKDYNSTNSPSLRKTKRVSFQVNGQFKEDWSANDIYFGAFFRKPVTLPYGSNIALGVAKIIDPALVVNLNSYTPSFYSPLVCGMSYMSIDTNSIHVTENFLSSDHQLDEKARSRNRRRFFMEERNRLGVLFKKEKLYGFEFTSGHADLNNMQLKLGICFGIEKYLNGQPITYEARSRRGKMFWRVEIYRE